jgi:tetratricopeptide (TPR) repeat protein
MRRLEQHRRLLAYATLAAFVFASVAAVGQAPAQSPGANPATEQPSIAPQPPPTPEELGDSLMAHKRYQAAIDAYKKAPKDSASAWNKMGIAYQMMFNADEARHCYERSLKLNPKDFNVLNNLGTLYDADKNFKAAERMYRKALKINPKSAIVLKNLGSNLLLQHKYKKGWKVYQSALAVDPHIFDRGKGLEVQNPASLQERGAMNYYMAKSCVRAGMNDCAIDYLRKAINEGFTNAKKIQEDGEFAGIRELPAFKRLLAEQKNP